MKRRPKMQNQTNINNNEESASQLNIKSFNARSIGKDTKRKQVFNALKNNIIPGAGIDVTEKEPISSEDPLLSLDNLIITPHTAGSSSVSREVGTRKQAENVIKILKGEAPHGLANPEVIKTIALMKTRSENSSTAISENQAL